MAQSTTMARVYEMREKLKDEQTVTPEHLADLDERLRLSFGHLECGSLSKLRQEPRVYQLRWRLKKARSLYRSVYEEDPHIFLPFILSTPPRACDKFKFLLFRQNHRQRHRIFLSEDCLELLETRAKKLGIKDNSDFRNFLDCLFKLGPDNSVIYHLH